MIKALILSDLDFQIALFEQLDELVTDFLRQKGFSVEKIPIGPGDLAFCRGCFKCWVTKPGECVIDDKMSVINRTYMNSDVVFWLSPVVFGQFSANIKNARDRWIPNMLPFFKVRPDGSSIHPPRYDEYPNTIVIGYKSDLFAEDRQLFIDITKKHLRETEVYLFEGEEDRASLIKDLESIKLAKVRGNI